MKPQDYLGLSDDFWCRLSDSDKTLFSLIRPMPSAKYEVDVQLRTLPKWLADQERECIVEGGVFELCPDFQRGHRAELLRSRQQG